MNIESARTQMIEQQVRACEVFDTEVLRVLAKVRREQFVPPEYRALAFADAPIPLPCAQHMMTPQLEGQALQALAMVPADSVLEVGTGSGYLTACLAALGGEVLSLEIFPALAEFARRNLHAHGVQGCQVHGQDVFDWQPDKKYDRILVTGSLPVYDERFEQWLTPGGRLFAVVGVDPAMEALLVTFDASGSRRRESLFETALAPLTNCRQPEQFRF